MQLLKLIFVALALCPATLKAVLFEVIEMHPYQPWRIGDRFEKTFRGVSYDQSTIIRTSNQLFNQDIFQSKEFIAGYLGIYAKRDQSEIKQTIPIANKQRSTLRLGKSTTFIESCHTNGLKIRDQYAKYDFQLKDVLNFYLIEDYKKVVFTYQKNPSMPVSITAYLNLHYMDTINLLKSTELLSLAAILSEHEILGMGKNQLGQTIVWRLSLDESISALSWATYGYAHHLAKKQQAQQPIIIHKKSTLSKPKKSANI